MIEKANEIAKEQKMEEIQINDESLVSEEEFQKVLSKYTIQERSKLHLYDLDNYCIFIASRYLNSVDDHINLTKVCKRLRYNTDKFHYNSVSVNYETVKFFPNIETLHCYDKQDKYLEGGIIIKYVDWVRRSCQEIEEIKKEHSGKVIEFKHIVFTKDNVFEEIKNQNLDNHYNFKYTIEIPDGVKEINEDAFERDYCIEEIHVPESVKIIPRKCFGNCRYLRKVVFAESLTKIPHYLLIKLSVLEEITISSQYELHGDRLFIVNNNRLESIELPTTIKKINGKEIQLEQLTTFTIPSNVTKLNDYCFSYCRILREIKGKYKRIWYWMFLLLL